MSISENQTVKGICRILLFCENTRIMNELTISHNAGHITRPPKNPNNSTHASHTCITFTEMFPCDINK